MKISNSVKKLFIIVIIVVIIIIGLFLIFNSKKQATEEPVNNKEQEGEEKREEGTEEKTQKQLEEESPDIISLKSQLGLQARSFIERYGTYSSDSNYSNWRSLMFLMSEKLRQKTSKKISEAKDEGFFSYTTKVISLNSVDFQENIQAVFMAQVQERKDTSEETKSSQKTIELIIKKEGGQWKVDEINYQE